MRHWLGMDVFSAARLRLEEAFDAFEQVYVSFSGGKDSGVVVQLALDIAREKGRLPLDVLLEPIQLSNSMILVLLLNWMGSNLLVKYM